MSRGASSGDVPIPLGQTRAPAPVDASREVSSEMSSRLQDLQREVSMPHSEIADLKTSDSGTPTKNHSLGATSRTESHSKKECCPSNSNCLWFRSHVEDHPMLTPYGFALLLSTS